MNYLEEAAAHLKRVAENLNEHPPGHAEDRRDRLRIAEGYIALAAIERGFRPGCPALGDSETGPWPGWKLPER